MSNRVKKTRGLWSGVDQTRESGAPVELRLIAEDDVAKMIWMCMIEEEDQRVVRELEVEAFENPSRVWKKLNEYTKNKTDQTFLEFINEPDDPMDFTDPTNYAWTWTVNKGSEEIRVHVLRMPLLEGE